jgi:hypothetical protein
VKGYRLSDWGLIPSRDFIVHCVQLSASLTVGSRNTFLTITQQKHENDCSFPSETGNGLIIPMLTHHAMKMYGGVEV